MYPYHNRIKQRIKNGELESWYFTNDYPGIGEALVLVFNTSALSGHTNTMNTGKFFRVMEMEKERNKMGGIIIFGIMFIAAVLA